LLLTAIQLAGLPGACTPQLGSDLASLTQHQRLRDLPRWLVTSQVRYRGWRNKLPQPQDAADRNARVTMSAGEMFAQEEEEEEACQLDWR
jgi:hypothetical protein